VAVKFDTDKPPPPTFKQTSFDMRCRKYELTCSVCHETLWGESKIDELLLSLNRVPATFLENQHKHFLECLIREFEEHWAKHFPAEVAK